MVHPSTAAVITKAKQKELLQKAAVRRMIALAQAKGLEGQKSLFRRLIGKLLAQA